MEMPEQNCQGLLMKVYLSIVFFFFSHLHYELRECNTFRTLYCTDSVVPTCILICILEVCQFATWFTCMTLHHLLRFWLTCSSHHQRIRQSKTHPSEIWGQHHDAQHQMPSLCNPLMMNGASSLNVSSCRSWTSSSLEPLYTVTRSVIVIAPQTDWNIEYHTLLANCYVTHDLSLYWLL